MTRAPYIFAANRERGFALIEAIIGAALICGLSLAVYTVFQPTSSSAAVKNEAIRLDQLRRKVSALYVTASDFSGIAQDPSLTADTSAANWGGVALSSATFTTASDGWAATYSKVPTDACEKLVLSQLGALWTEIDVGGKPVSTAPAGLTLCQATASNTVRFAEWGGLRGSAGVGSLFPPGAPHAPAAPIGVPMPPVGVAGSPSPAPPAPTSPVPPAPVSGPVGAPTPPPVAPPKPVYPPCVPPPPGMQTVACPSGQISSISPYGANGISQRRVATCVAPTGPNFTWGPWTTVSDTCAPVCVITPPVTSWGPCSNFDGLYSDGRQYAGTYYTRSDASCAAPTGSAVYGGAYFVSPTNCYITNTCSAPAPAVATRTVSCPAGQTGSISQSQTTTYSCPGTYGPSTGAAGAWVTTSNTCVSAKPTLSAPNNCFVIDPSGAVPAGQPIAPGPNITFACSAGSVTGNFKYGANDGYCQWTVTINDGGSSSTVTISKSYNAANYGAGTLVKSYTVGGQTATVTFPYSFEDQGSGHDGDNVATVCSVPTVN
jgi:type II secretory pathway pseudopilin PulG